MHGKRVTSEPHDSYFRLMTIKLSISKIQWAIVLALNYFIIELSWVPKQLPVKFQTVETRCGRESHTRPRGPSESPDGVDPNIRTRKSQRDGHNSGVKIWSLCSVSSTLLHANLEQPFQTLQIKREVNMFVKKSSCVLSSCVFPLASLSLCRCELFYIYMCMYVDVNLHMWLYNIARSRYCPSFHFFFQFYSVVSQDNKVDNYASSPFLLIIIRSGLLAEIW